MTINLSKLARTAAPLAVMIAAICTPSRAEITYPFCKIGGGDVGTGVGSCNYTSLEQCRISSAGFGICQANPAYVPSTAASAARRERR